MPGNPNERLIEALEGGAPHPPAAAPVYLGLYLEPQRRQALAQVYAETAQGADRLRLSFDEEIQARVEAWARTVRLLRCPPAWLPTSLGPARASVHGCEVSLRGGSCLWTPPDGGRPMDLLAPYDDTIGDRWEVPGEIPRVEDVLRELGSPTEDDLLKAGHLEYPARVVERVGAQFVVAGALGTPYWHCYERLGFAGMMRALREHTDVMLAIMTVNLDRLITRARAYRRAGVTCMFVEECLSSADLISEKDYLRFAYPGTHDLLLALKDLGFYVVYYYCGAVEGRLPHLAGLPADALAFEESKKDFILDLGRIRAEVGPERLLFGNTAAVLLRDGTQQQIAEDMALQYAQAGPRYVAGIGSPATLDTPPQKLDMLMRAADGLG